MDLKQVVELINEVGTENLLLAKKEQLGDINYQILHVKEEIGLKIILFINCDIDLP
jgi:hypothetical protein